MSFPKHFEFVKSRIVKILRLHRSGDGLKGVDRDLVRQFFDQDYYLKNNEDVGAAGVDPFGHYLNYGWQEGRDPSGDFSTRGYLNAYPDVRKAGINPLIHFVLQGRDEGRGSVSVPVATDSLSAISAGSESALGRSSWGAAIVPLIRGIKSVRSIGFFLQRLTNKGRWRRGSPVFYENYRHQFSIAKGARSPLYAPLMQRHVEVRPGDPKFLAFYLPQFHPFPENDRWWGKGFTEWTNVSKATPQFSGHYQPRLPGELGFYDLRGREVMVRQVQLARQYGVSGFCYHYYWFDGKRLMDKPLDMFLNDSSEELDFPFCLCWANENWTRKWDGAEQDVLIRQNHSREDSIAVFEDLLGYMQDRRYITVDGKPVLLIYRPAIIPDMAEYAQLWRELAREAGLPGLHLVASNSFGFTGAEALGFDAIAEFPPHGISSKRLNRKLHLLNYNYKGKVFDYDLAVKNSMDKLLGIEKAGRGANYYPGIMAGWDNEARRPGSGNVFHGADPAKFSRWLEFARDWSVRNHGESSRFVFINAWNEWAEGTYLEPDRYYGYAFLNAVSRVRDRGATNRDALEQIAGNIKTIRKSEGVICAHVFYEEMIDEFALAVSEIKAQYSFDVAVSIPEFWSPASASRLVKALRPVALVVCGNRGRDVWPFIQVIRKISSLGYKFGCKVHSKKSPHLAAGSCWGKNLISSLLDKEAVQTVLDMWKGNPNLGVIAPSASVCTASGDTMLHNSAGVGKLLGLLGLKRSNPEKFIAGTMFWFFFEPIKSICSANITEEHFEIETGAIDGTFAHAFERIIPGAVERMGYSFGTYDYAKLLTPY